jgi:hypothetical protein
MEVIRQLRQEVEQLRREVHEMRGGRPQPSGDGERRIDTFPLERPRGEGEGERERDGDEARERPSFPRPPVREDDDDERKPGDRERDDDDQRKPGDRERDDDDDDDERKPGDRERDDDDDDERAEAKSERGVPTIVLTVDGRVHTGLFLPTSTGDTVHLLVGEKTVRIPRADVEELRPAPVKREAPQARFPARPDVAGVVVMTRSPENGNPLVEISIGSDDGLTKGRQLEVFDGERKNWLGTIEVIYLTPDGAVGRVTKQANAEIEFAKGQLIASQR